jgi:aryl-alcohol dehydrogenase-like predicted oxidoreductase
VPFSPLGRGFFTGTIDETTQFEPSDVRASFPRFTAEARRANHGFVTLLATVAARRNATPGQVALAWLLAQRPWIVPIPGTRRLGRLDENLHAGELELSPDDLAEIELGSVALTVHGARYPESLERLTGR